MVRTLGLEFKRDDIQPRRLAGEIVALLNLEGGHILLGVEDDATAFLGSLDSRKKLKNGLCK